MSGVFGGCATVTNGTTQTVPVSSSPSGARVFADGQHVGTTPCQVELSRRTSHIISFEKEGYEDTAVHLTREVSAMTAGNVLIGGLIGLGVDAVSGANFRLVPEAVSVSLQRSPETLGGLERRSGVADTIFASDRRVRY